MIIWRVNDYLENEGKGRVACKPKGGEQKIVYDILMAEILPGQFDGPG